MDCECKSFELLCISEWGTIYEIQEFQVMHGSVFERSEVCDAENKSLNVSSVIQMYQQCLQLTAS